MCHQFLIHFTIILYSTSKSYIPVFVYSLFLTTTWKQSMIFTYARTLTNNHFSLIVSNQPLTIEVVGVYVFMAHGGTHAVSGRVAPKSISP